MPWTPTGKLRIPPSEPRTHPLSEPAVLGNVVYVDTGIGYGHVLTMINLADLDLINLAEPSWRRGAAPLVDYRHL
jgi:hypothetical protein